MLSHTKQIYSHQDQVVNFVYLAKSSDFLKNNNICFASFSNASSFCKKLGRCLVQLSRVDAQLICIYFWLDRRCKLNVNLLIRGSGLMVTILDSQWIGLCSNPWGIYICVDPALFNSFLIWCTQEIPEDVLLKNNLSQ